jgi:hypothetical protein
VKEVEHRSLTRAVGKSTVSGWERSFGEAQLSYDANFGDRTLSDFMFPIYV